MNIRIITASAGSGKTTRLSELLDAAIGEDRVDPERIVAMTFTKHAAAELVERARSRLLQSGRGDRAHRLLAARIGTVNSVCGSFVSDFAFELGLSPAVRVLDEGAAETELKRSLASVVGAEVADELQAFPQRFDGQLDWRHEVRKLVETARTNDLSGTELRACAERSILSLDACLGACEADAAAIDAALAVAMDHGLTAIDLGADGTKGTREYVDFLRKSRGKLKDGRLGWGDWAKLAGGMSPRKKSLEHVADITSAAARHLGHPVLRQEMRRLIELVYAVAADGLEAYQRHKRDRGVIDYVDQERFALQLLLRPDVQSALEGQLDLVLVDEFQDTSPLQLAIFLQLARLATESVWVGDPKQAIYGFRGTDPKLMDTAIESLTSTSNDPELVTKAVATIGAHRRVETLSTSYRSRAELVQLTNDIFAPAFAQQGMPEERTRLAPAHLTEPSELGHIIEVWPLQPPGRSNNVKRAQCAAAAVKDLLARQPLVRERDNGGGSQKVALGDVAVLCRTNDQCQLVADALMGIGVDVVVPRMGLLETAEGQVTVAALRLWLDPRDSLAATEIARLISFPDDGNALAKRVLDAPGMAAFAEEATVQRVLETRKRRPDLGVLEVLDAVFIATDARGLAARWGDAPQRIANLDALRGHADSYVNEAAGSREAPTVAGLLVYLDSLVDESGWYQTRTDRQALSGDGNAVTVSTWHRAKGLEWPVAVLYGLETLRAPTCYGVHVVSDRATFDVDEPLADRWVRFWPNPYSTSNQGGLVKDAFESSAAFADIVDRANREALRVLYVGWTRARDRLILAAEAGKMTKGLLGKLIAISPELISEPSSQAAEEQVLTWAGRRIQAWVSPAQPSAGDSLAPKPGAVIEGLSDPPPYAPAKVSPSMAEPVASSIGDIIELGPRLPIHDCDVDVGLMGDAVHGFLACDSVEASRHDRIGRARSLLEGHGVADHLSADSVVEASDRLWCWLREAHGNFRIHRELPVTERLPSGAVVSGTADMVLTSDVGFVLIDHKTFPGAFASARERALSYSGQLATYASAVAEATGSPMLSTWIHLPVLGKAIEVRLEAAQCCRG